MRKLLPKIRLVSAYASLGLLFAGWAAFILVFIQVQTPFDKDSATNNSAGLQAQRMAAIEEAKKQGKHEYSFDANKIPVPVSP